MLTFLFEPFRVILAYAESIVMFFGALFGAGQAIMPHGDYLFQLNRTGIYGNCAQNALPQTALHDIVTGHFNQDRTDGKAPKCLIIGYDGARADALAHTADDARSAVQAVKADGGKIYNMYCGGDLFRRQKTSTSPGWTNLLTGHWANERGGTGHGITDNGIVKAPEAPKLLFNNLFEIEKPISRAAFVVSWTEYFDYDGAVWYHDKAYAEEKGYNIHWLNHVYDGDAVLCNAGLAQIQIPANDMIMVTLDACDYAGHGDGFGSYNPKYVEAFTASEHYGHDLIQAVKARPTYANEDWLLIVTTDHGGWRLGHGSQFAPERQTFFAINRDLGI